MSQNLYRLTNRTQIVDARGMPTPEFLRFTEALFARAGGFEGFSNQELFGEVSSPDYRDEMLERIGALEAQLRGTIEQAQQVIQYVFESAQTQAPTMAGTTQDSLNVKGPVHLNSANGRTLIGNPTDDGETRLQVDGDLRADNIHAGGDLTAQSAEVAIGYSVAGDEVVGPRITGWGAPTGTADRSAYAAFPGLTAAATYDQTQLQDLADALQEASARLVALIADARTHGLIGD